MRTFSWAYVPWLLAILLLVFIASPVRGQTGPETERIVIEEGGAFEPSTVEIPSGWSVEWVNNDTFAHVLLIDFGEDEPFNVGEIMSGESVTIAFDEEGTYGFYLEADEDEEGSVVVGDGGDATPTPAATATEEQSSASTATPTQRSGSVASPGESGTPSASPSASPSPSPTPQETPPAPSAGTGGMFSTGGPGATGAVTMVGIGVMLVALSSVLRSAAVGRIAVRHRRGPRDRQ